MTRWEGKELRRRIRRYNLPHRVVLRAKILLALDRDPCITITARTLGVDAKTVRRFRDRFLDEGRLKALDDHPRSGRPWKFDAVTRCEVIAMACGRPSDFDVLHHEVWTVNSLHERFLETHPGLEMSRATVLRILNEGDIRPHRIRMWLHSPDPLFRPKVTEICELYLNPPPNSEVLCVDEKTGMQALGRKHPVKWPKNGDEGRFDFEYVRNGTRKLLAAFNVATGEVYGEVRANRKAVDLVEFMEEIARQHPRKQIHIIWDNLNIHFDGKDKRWTRFNRRHGNRFHFHYTPVHASWVNQVEIFFGILHKRVLRYGVFNCLEELDDALCGFIEHWNKHEAHPFRWTFKGYPLQSGRKAA